MDIPIEDILRRYAAKVGELTQQLLIAEAQRDVYKERAEAAKSGTDTIDPTAKES